MDDQALVIGILSLLVAIAILVSSSKKTSRSKLPPSPFGLPVIGHLHLLAQLPHQALADLSRKYGPYMLIRFGSKPALVISSSAAAREVLKTHDLAFASRPQGLYTKILNYNGLDLIMAPYGEHWRNTRKLCTLELFTAKQAASFRPIREAEMSHLIQQLYEIVGSCVNLREKLSAFTFCIITRMIMGKSYSTSDKDNDVGAFLHLLNERDELTTGAALGNYIPWLVWLDRNIAKVRKNHEEMDKLVQKQIDEHRKDLQSMSDCPKDFIDVMLRLCDQGQLQNTTMKALLVNIVMARTETSATTSEWAMAELAKNPQVMKKLGHELDQIVGEKNAVNESHLDKLEYLKAVVKETLRLHPVAPLMVPHESTEECEVAGKFVIPARTQLFVNVYAIGRDPEVWKNPCEFFPERFLEGDTIEVGGQSFDLLPFGSGRRSCPGINLALPTIYLTLASLVHAFQWQVPDGTEVDLGDGFGLLLHLAVPLKLIPVARK